MAESPETLVDMPSIKTRRCDLAALDMSDAADLCALTDDPVITDAIDFLPSPFTKTDAESLIVGQTGGLDRFIGIRNRGDNRLAGVVGAHLRNNDAIEIGYWIGADFRGFGYAAEAVSAITNVLQAAFPHRLIFAECRPENVASWNLLTKMGFVPTGADGTRRGRKTLILRH